MEPKMTILFIGKKSRMTQHHLLPIYLRVIIDGKRFEVTTHQHVKPSEWSASAGQVIGRSGTTLQINTELDLIKKKVYDYKERIRIEERDFTINSLREKWFGQERNTRTLLEAFRLSNLDFQKLVEKGIYKRATFTKYLTTERHLLSFLNWRNTGTRFQR